MHAKLNLLLLAGLAWHLAWGQGPSRCIAAPDPVVVMQPDGKHLTIQGVGDVYESYSRTVDGYTVLYHPTDGGYYYGVQNSAGLLVRSAVLAHNPADRGTKEQQFLAGVPQALRYHPAQLELWAQYAQQTAESGSPPDVPRTGTVKVPVLLIDYPDLPHQFSPSAFDSLFNQTNYDGIGSVKDYYLEVSYGQLTLQFTIYGWFHAKNNYQTYGKTNGNNAARDLVREAIDSAEAAGMDWTPYDNDSDGDVDAVIVIHAGPGAEQGSRTQYIWSHRWSISPRYYDGKAISDYFIGPEVRTRSSGDVIVRIGVMCHEFGHSLGLPDLYDTDKSNGRSAGIGEWGLMGSGNWLGGEKRPSHMCAWSKRAMGWIHPDTLAAGAHTLNAAAFDSSDIYIITTPVAHEYFMVENRQKVGFDSALRGHGLAIWHINDSIIFYTYRWNKDEELKAVDLEEADGMNDLDSNVNRSDAGDLFPGSSNNTAFTDSTNPNARNYNGAPSGVRIININEDNAQKTISFVLGAMPSVTMHVNNPKSAYCVNDTISLTAAAQNADSIVWILPTGQQVINQTAVQFAFSDTGTYAFSVMAFNTGTGLAASDSITAAVTAGPTAAFLVDSVAGLTAWFANQSAGAAAYYWDFGDGTTAYAFNPVHTFPQPGTYAVQLTALSAGGCEDSTSQVVSVSGPGTGWGTPALSTKCRGMLSDGATLSIKADAPVRLIRLYAPTGKLLGQYHSPAMPLALPKMPRFFLVQVGLADGRQCLLKMTHQP